MRCAVYCLVSRPDQLDPLVDRLKDAGVSTRDISVVLPRGPSPSSDAWQQLWWPFLWPLTFYDWAPAEGKEGGRVISLAQYQAWRGG